MIKHFVFVIFLLHCICAFALSPSSQILQNTQEPYYVYGILDLKAIEDATGNVRIKILEIGRGEFSSFYGFPDSQQHNQKDPIREVVATDLLSLNLPVIAYNPHKTAEHINNNKGIFGKIGSNHHVYYCQTEEELLDQLTQFKGQALIVPSYSVEHKTIDPQLQNILKPFPQAVILGNLAYFDNLQEDKFATHCLFNKDSKLLKFRPKTAAYTPKWTPYLTQKILKDIGPAEAYVIKPREGVRGEGIVIASPANLEKTLADLLLPYNTFQALYPGYYQQSFINAHTKAYLPWKKKHQLPNFIIESLEHSNPLNGFDPTMRIVFRIYHNPRHGSHKEVKIIESYWNKRPAAAQEKLQQGMATLTEAYVTDLSTTGDFVSKPFKSKVQGIVQEQILPSIFEQIHTPKLLTVINQRLNNLSDNSDPQEQLVVMELLTILLNETPSLLWIFWSQLQNILLPHFELWADFFKHFYINDQNIEFLLNNHHQDLLRMLEGNHFLFIRDTLIDTLRKATEDDQPYKDQAQSLLNQHNEHPYSFEELLNKVSKKELRLQEHYIAQYHLNRLKLSSEQANTLWIKLWDELNHEDVHWYELFVKHYQVSEHFPEILKKHFEHIEDIAYHRHLGFARIHLLYELFLLIYNSNFGHPAFKNPQIISKVHKLFLQIPETTLFAGLYLERLNIPRYHWQEQLQDIFNQKNLNHHIKLILTQHLVRRIPEDQIKDFIPLLHKHAGSLRMPDNSLLSSHVLLSQSA